MVSSPEGKETKKTYSNNSPIGTKAVIVNDTIQTLQRQGKGNDMQRRLSEYLKRALNKSLLIASNAMTSGTVGSI